MTKCKNCGAPLEGGVCAYCGSRFVEESKERTQEHVPFTSQKNNYEEEKQDRQYQEMYSSKSKGFTTILVIFFGFLGFHHFYTGRFGKGMLYLCTLGLCYFGWFYDIYRVCTGRFVDSQGYQIR